MTRTMPLEDFLGAYRRLAAGSALAADLTRHDLAAAGYLRSNVVLEPGQFAIRGGILGRLGPGLSAAGAARARGR